MPWWTMPAITLGVALYAKHKRKAGKVRWVAKTEEDVKKLPVGIVLARLIEYGDALPAPPEGYTWREITMLVSTSPISAPEELKLNVLEPLFNGPVTLDAFLTEQQLQDPTALGDMGSTYLTSQEAETSPELGALDAGLAQDLAARGLVLAELPSHEIGEGDIVVLRSDCSVHNVTGFQPEDTVFLREIAPIEGRNRITTAWLDLACAYGVRPKGWHPRSLQAITENIKRDFGVR